MDFAEAIAILGTTHFNRLALARCCRRVLPAYCDITLQEWAWETGGEEPAPADVTDFLTALVDARPDQLVASGLHADRVAQVQTAALLVLRALVEPPTTPAAPAAWAA